ncbi:MAG: hypothetical protein K8F91_26125 [Candidatus Obscuribacterales bacterium]|nr:hypothetical protein [Candidatus Obscuribacterales bacterium]
MAESLESFSLSEGAVDSSVAFQSEVFDSTIGKRSGSSASSEAPSASFERAADAPPVPAGVDAQSWGQISQMIQAGNEVSFTTAGEGPPADFILGADGKLVQNPAKTTPPEGGKVTIQVDGKGDDAGAKQAALRLDVAAIEEKIYYWQKANPGSANIPQYLQSMLAGAQSRMNVSSAPPETNQPAPVQERPQEVAPQPVEQAPAPSQAVSRPSGGGGGGGGSPQRLGNRNIGSAPEGGSRRGSFEPNGPIDRNAIPKPIEGDLPIKGPPSANAEQIQEFLLKMGSPAAKEEGFAQALYDATTERGIDPAVAVGFFLQESTCGRYGRAHDNKSLGNIKGTAPESGGSDGTFRRYNTWAEGARDWARLIDESYVGKRGLTSLSQVIGVYAPSSDGNNESRYVATVNGVVQNFKNMNDGTSVA